MDNYLLDHETLGQIVDKIMEAKPMPAATPEELNSLRETNIKKLDDKITMSILGSLTDEQLAKINILLDNDDGSPDVYEKFFNDAGVDIQATITKAAQEFGAELLGGQNA